MENVEFIINPKVKIRELLDHYPQLEEVLISIAPVFSKLKNPVLRRTIARVTTLQQAAVVGNVPLDKLINTLRQHVGQDDISVENSTNEAEIPEWFNSGNISISYDAIEDIESGGHPLEKVLRDTNELMQGEIYELITGFVPAPLIDKVEARGFKTFNLRENDKVHTFFIKA